MAVYHGKSAKVDFGGLISFITGWSLSTSADIAESTDMGDTWKLFEPGFDDVTFTIEGHASTERDTAAEIVAAAGVLKCYIDATNYFACTAFCTSITESVDLNDVGKLTYTFEMNDAAGLIYA